MNGLTVAGTVPDSWVDMAQPPDSLLIDAVYGYIAANLKCRSKGRQRFKIAYHEYIISYCVIKFEEFQKMDRLAKKTRRKDKAIHTLDTLPDEFAIEELVERLLFIEKVEEGLKQADNIFRRS